MAPAEPAAVTVVIPTAGRTGLLVRAVKSVLGQQYDGSVECLIVFDGPMGVIPVCELVPGRSLRAIRNTRSAGLAGARNTGVLAARGEVVAFLDDDDEWMPAKLRRQAQVLDQLDADVAGCGNVVIFDGQEHERLAPAAVSFADLVRSRVAVLHSSTIVARRDAVIERIGLVDERNSTGGSEDYEWQLRVARHGPIAMAPEPLARIHWHSGSRFARHWEAFVSGLVYVLQRNPEFQLEPRGAARIYGQIAFGNAAMGRTGAAVRWATRCLTSDWRQPRGYLSLLVAARMLSPERVLRVLHSRGKGV
jgi:glycosyltransferase involved in cell wall biosynthesis